MHNLNDMVTFARVVEARSFSEAARRACSSKSHVSKSIANQLATIDLVRDHLNPRLAIDGVVLTMADGRTNLSAEVDAEARRHLGHLVYSTVIPRSVRLSKRDRC